MPLHMIAEVNTYRGQSASKVGIRIIASRIAMKIYRTSKIKSTCILSIFSIHQ